MRARCVCRRRQRGLEFCHTENAVEVHQLLFIHNIIKANRRHQNLFTLTQVPQVQMRWNQHTENPIRLLEEHCWGVWWGSGRRRCCCIQGNRSIIWKSNKLFIFMNVCGASLSKCQSEWLTHTHNRRNQIIFNFRNDLTPESHIHLLLIHRRVEMSGIKQTILEFSSFGIERWISTGTVGLCSRHCRLHSNSIHKILTERSNMITQKSRMFWITKICKQPIGLSVGRSIGLNENIVEAELYLSICLQFDRPPPAHIPHSIRLPILKCHITSVHTFLHRPMQPSRLGKSTINFHI